MNIKCIGCGAVVQTENKNKKGYIDKKVLENKKDSFYCKRCFDLKHYNRENKVETSLDEYLKNLQEIKKDKGLFVYIVDLFDFEGSLIYNINDIIGSNNILLVLNKVDLFLDSLNKNKIKDYVLRYLKEKQIKIKDLVLMSSYNDDDVFNLYNKILELHNNKNVYFVGMTNVGKSTIINKIIKNFTGEDDIITVSNTVNTTLDNIYIPLNDDCFIVDTPGLLNRNNLIYFLDKKTLEYITPKKYVKPKTFQLNPEQTLFINGFIRIDFISGERSSFVGNFANNVLVHRTKLANADSFYDSHKDDVLLFPTKLERQKLGNFVTKKVNFTKEQKIDIAISGLGFLSVYGTGTLVVTYFNNVKVIVRKAMI